MIVNNNIAKITSTFEQFLNCKSKEHNLNSDKIVEVLFYEYLDDSEKVGLQETIQVKLKSGIEIKACYLHNSKHNYFNIIK